MICSMQWIICPEQERHIQHESSVNSTKIFLEIVNEILMNSKCYFVCCVNSCRVQHIKYNDCK